MPELRGKHVENAAIEVKAFGGVARGEFLWVEVSQYDEARRNANFHFYVVDNVRQGDPALFRLKVFGGDSLQRLLLRAKERRYYEVSLPVAEFDAPSSVD